MSNSTLFDTIRAEFGLKSDKALAGFIGVSEKTICASRAETPARVTGDTMILIHEETGWPIWKIKELIASDVVVRPPRKTAAKVGPKPKPLNMPKCIPPAPVKPTSFIHRML